ncbi:ankyrin repeat domain-containing protein [Cryptosporangium aurantiacum]|uniref:Ankyrin repeat n=1 Tax=Cryptosporangium aurantiacum TaxID=134849 RepID=A0A1M7RF43_9ACTN|nr:ankyrin repeat domain-containing protein [Cryptosporangium aurantiacum]SHN44923.1 Ankyrin repeat [Cryptosporangium aurantiacum]
MPSRLPRHPHLDVLRREARTLQRAARSGDPAALARVGEHHGRPATPEFPLAAAQLVVAREYGFASWPRLRRYVDVVTDYGWDGAVASVPASNPADEFCRLACLTYTDDDGPHRWAAAARLLAEQPELTRTHIWAAAAAGRPADVRAFLAGDRSLARARGGPFGWRPLCYLTYSRTDALDAVAVAGELLAAGADPGEGFLFTGQPYTFTPLTGVLGGGERSQPRHPRWRQLARLLLDEGADPNDDQALYNNMFSPANDHLVLLFEYGLGHARSESWSARLVASPGHMLRTQLRWAVEHDQLDRVRLLTVHGVNIDSPYEGDRPVWAAGDGRTPIELALLYGNTEIADYLLAHGARPPRPDPVSELIAAAFRADRAAVQSVRDRNPGVLEETLRARPGLVVWGAAQAPAGVVELLVELGFGVNALGRADAPVEQEWETALHHSAGEGDVDLTRRLLALGADPLVRDRRFDATPLDWARHLHQEATARLLEAPGSASDQ